MQAVLHHTTKITDDITTFWFKPERQVYYTAGQYIGLHLPHDKPDERGDSHWFTLSSSPTEAPLISITTKIVADSSSLKRTLSHLRPGAKVTISEPMGDFVLPKDPNIKLLFLAVGIGLTPMRSMVKWLTDTKEKRSIQMIYAVKSEADFAFIDLFLNYGVDLKILVSEPSMYWDGLIGKLDGPRVLLMADEALSSLIYLSGPEKLVETINAELLGAGIDRSRLVTDHFPGYASL